MIGRSHAHEALLCRLSVVRVLRRGGCGHRARCGWARGMLRVSDCARTVRHKWPRAHGRPRATPPTLSGWCFSARRLYARRSAPASSAPDASMPSAFSASPRLSRTPRAPPVILPRADAAGRAWKPARAPAPADARARAAIAARLPGLAPPRQARLDHCPAGRAPSARGVVPAARPRRRAPSRALSGRARPSDGCTGCTRTRACALI